MSVGTFDPVYFQEHRARQDWNNQMSFFPNAREAGSCFVDGNSLLRNGTSTAASCTALPAFAGVFVGASALVGGVAGVPVGLSVVRDGYKKIKAAVACRDLEGVVHKGLWCGVGATYAGLSGILAADGVMTLQGVAPPSAITPAFGYLGIGLYGALLAHSGYGLYYASKFQGELKAVLKSEGDEGGLKWLSQQIGLSGEDLEKPQDEQARLLQKKWNRFELRTNSECAALVREKLPALIEQFDPVQARELIVEVEKSAFKERVKHILLIVLALLGIAASICVLILTGPASPLLFAVGALTWFTVDSSKLHNYIGEKCWAWFSKKDPELLEEQI